MNESMPAHISKARGIRDVLRLHVVAGRNGDAHLFGDLAGMLAETERRVDMHHVHTIERLAKQRVARSANCICCFFATQLTNGT